MQLVKLGFIKKGHEKQITLILMLPLTVLNGDEHFIQEHFVSEKTPERWSPQVHSKLRPVRSLVHINTDRKVRLEDQMGHVHEDGVHPLRIKFNIYKSGKGHLI